MCNFMTCPATAYVVMSYDPCWYRNVCIIIIIIIILKNFFKFLFTLSSRPLLSFFYPR